MSVVMLGAVSSERARYVVRVGLGVAALVALIVVFSAGLSGAVARGDALSGGLGLLCGGCVVGLVFSHYRRGLGEADSLHTEIAFARTILEAKDADHVRHLSRQHALAGAVAQPRRRWGQFQHSNPRPAEVVELADLALTSMTRLAAAEIRAATDFLTGLATKQVLGDTLARMVAQADRTLEPMALVMVDVDHFKDVNDRFGHPVGDLVLAQVGAVLRRTVRSSDFTGRIGGEEFAVILPNTGLDGAAQVAEAIRSAIGAIRLDDADVSITASAGVAVYPEHATRPDQLEHLADSALYEAKRAGRNQVRLAASRQQSAA